MTTPPETGPARRNASLGRRTLRGLAWMSVSGGGRALLQIGTLVILARLVSPAEFGISSAGLVVVAFTAVFTEAGIGPALVHATSLTPRHVRTGLTVQVTLATALWLGLLVTAPRIAAIFRIPELAAVLPVMTSVLVIRSLTLGQHLLLRALDFRRVAMIELTAWTIGNAGLSIVLALMGYGVWAIVLGHVGEAVLATAGFARQARHPYRPQIDGDALRQLLGFGGGYTLGWWANFVARQGDNFVVGRWLGAEALGLYTRAYSLMRQPATLFGQVVNRVLFPAMATVQTDRERLRRMYFLGVTTVAVLVFPMMVVGHVLAPDLVVVVLGERWLPLTQAFDVMVFGMLFRTSYKLSDSLATATGHVYRRAARQFIYAGLVVGGALVGRQWGISGVAAGILVALMANFVLMADLSLRITGGRWSEFVRAHVPGALLASIVAVPAMVTADLMRTRWGLPSLAVVVGTATIASITTFGFVRVAPRIRATRGLSDLLLELTGRVSVGSRLGRAARAVLGDGYALHAKPPIRGMSA